jgi:trigger factor
MIGAVVGETREFRLSYPSKEENAEISDEVAGKSVDFTITVKQIENVELPEINDEFASSLATIFDDPDQPAPALEEVVSETAAPEAIDGETTEGESTSPAKPKLTLEQFREKIRESLYREAKQAADNEYSDKVLEEIVKGAQVAYPDMMVEEQLDSMIQNLDQRLRQQGLTLEQFMSLTRKSKEDIRNEYRQSAEDGLKRSLVLFEIAVAEKIRVEPEDFEAHIVRTMKRLGFDSPEFRKTFDNPSVRDNILNRLLQDKTFERIAAIGKGEAPEVPAETQVVELATASAGADADSTPNQE